MTEPRQILEHANSILLLDPTDASIPQALLALGLMVFCFSSGCYMRAYIKNISRDLFFIMTEEPLLSVDIVMIFCPASKHADIIRDHVLPLQAGIIFLQSPFASHEARQLAMKNGLVCIEINNIRNFIS
jgi:hypothetical protein